MATGYGADPNDDESLYHAAGHTDNACLRLLLGHGARVDGTNAFAVAVTPGNVGGVRLLLEAGGDPGRPQRGPSDGHLADRALSPLPIAVAVCGVDVVEPIPAAGADPNAMGTDHRSGVRRATRAGRRDVAELLRYGADDDTTDADNFVGACLRADRDTAQRVLAQAPGLLDRLIVDDLGTFADADGATAWAAV